MPQPPIDCLLFSSYGARFLLKHLRFLSCPEVVRDAFEWSAVPCFDADVLANAAQAMVLELEAGTPVKMDRTNTLLLVEAVEGTSQLYTAPISQRAGLVSVAQMIAKRLEPYAGRKVELELGPIYTAA